MSRTEKQMKHDNTMLELDRLMRKFYFSRDTITQAMEVGTPTQVGYLTQLLENEMERRSVARVSRMIKSAGFPSIKSIRDYDFSNVSFPHSLNGRFVVTMRLFLS